MAANSKPDLIAITEREFEKLTSFIEPIDADTALKKRDEDTSIKDVVAHRAHWIDLFLGWYADGMAGKPVYFPAEGYKWSDLKRYNADLRARQSSLGWPESVALLRTKNRDLMEFIKASSDDDLYGGPMRGANSAWTPGRWAEAAGASHYRSALKYIRKAVKSDRSRLA